MRVSVKQCASPSPAPCDVACGALNSGNEGLHRVLQLQALYGFITACGLFPRHCLPGTAWTGAAAWDACFKHSSAACGAPILCNTTSPTTYLEQALLHVGA